MSNAFLFYHNNFLALYLIKINIDKIYYDKNNSKNDIFKIV